jgi:threonine aldolase
MIRGFGSDNCSGVLPEVLKALEEASYGHQHSYGEDAFTARAEEDFKRIFGPEIALFFVYNGTGANVLSISALTRPYHAVICAETAHIHVDECGAIERLTGCKLLTLPTFDGKLNVELIQNHLHGFGDQHHVQPRVVSLTQCTELGTVYTPEEIRAICDLAHARGMYVHVDGARLANAVAYLGVPPATTTRDAGVDVLSFGGTKNGLLFGEAVIFFNTSLAGEVKYLRKQMMQLHSKGRFIAAQFSAVLKNDRWLQSAGHANAMARLLAREAAQVPGVKITQEVQANEVFAIIPRECIAPLQQECFFYLWDANASEVRWVCSFDTTENDIFEFIALLRSATD